MEKIGKDYKIAVSPEQSRQIQEICFQYDVGWGNNKCKVANIDSSHLYIYPSKNNMRYGDNMRVFRNHRNTEISAEDFIRIYGNSEVEKTEKGENTKQPFLIIRSTKEDEFSKKLNNIYEKYTNIEVDYKPVLSNSGNIIYTALVKVLDASGDLDKVKKLNIG